MKNLPGKQEKVPVARRISVSGYTWAFYVLFGCFSLLYALTLGREGFWFDEVKTVLAGRMALVDMIIERTQAGHLPFFFVVSRQWQSLVGESEFAMRLLPLFFGLLAVVVFFFLIKRLATPRCAFWASLLLLVNPEIVYLCQFARFYTLLLLVGLGAVYLIVVSEDEPSGLQAAGLSVLLTVFLFIHYSAVLVFIALMAYLLFRKRPRWKLIVAGIPAVLLFLTWISFSLFASGSVSALTHASGYRLIETLALLVKLSGTIQLFSRSQIESGIVLLPSLVAMVTLGITFWAAFSLEKKDRVLLYLVFVPVALTPMFGLFHLSNPAETTRYFAMSLVAQVGINGIFLASGNAPLPIIRRVLLLFLIVMNLGGVQSYLFNDEGSFYTLRYGLRETAQRVESRRLGTEKVYYAGDASNLAVFRYYTRGEAMALQSLMQQADPPNLRDGFPLAQQSGARPGDAAITGYWVFVFDQKKLTPAERTALDRLDRTMEHREEIPVRKGLLLHYTVRTSRAPSAAHR